MTPDELAAKGLRVKPLVWRPAPWSSPREEVLWAPLQGNLRYRVIGTMHTGYRVFDPVEVHRIGEGRTADEAKAAAEAHHAAAIAAMIGGDDDRSRRTDHHHDPRTVGSTDRHDDSETVR